MITNHHRNTFKLVILLFIIYVFVQNRRYPQKLLWSKWCSRIVRTMDVWVFSGFPWLFSFEIRGPHRHLWVAAFPVGSGWLCDPARRRIWWKISWNYMYIFCILYYIICICIYIMYYIHIIHIIYIIHTDLYISYLHRNMHAYLCIDILVCIWII
jgi:hypothetical protein